MSRTLLTLAAIALLTSPAAAMVFVDEDFEGYADTAALNAVWPIIAGQGVGTNGTLIDQTYSTVININTFENYPLGQKAFDPASTGLMGKGVEHTGGGVIGINLAAINGGQPIVPTESQKLVVRGDIFNTGAYANKRMSIGLRTNTPAANLLELGFFNADASGYAVRMQLFPSTTENPNPNWVMLPLDPALDGADPGTTVTTFDVGEVWATYTAEILPNSVKVEIDFDRDGLNRVTGLPGPDTVFMDDLGPGATGFNEIRIGSPSGIASAGQNGYGGVVFDNIYVALENVTVDPGVPGDANDDGFVDLLDLDILGANFGTLTGATVAQGDFNDDGAVDLLDLDILGANFGTTPPMTVGVPEPAGLLVAAMGLGAIANRRR